MICKIYQKAKHYVLLILFVVETEAHLMGCRSQTENARDLSLVPPATVLEVGLFFGGKLCWLMGKAGVDRGARPQRGGQRAQRHGELALVWVATEVIQGSCLGDPASSKFRGLRSAPGKTLGDVSTMPKAPDPH